MYALQYESKQLPLIRGPVKKNNSTPGEGLTMVTDALAALRAPPYRCSEHDFSVLRFNAYADQASM